MKKLTLIVLLVLMGIVPVFCEKYAEVAEMMESFVNHTNEYADAILAAETGEEIAEIFLKYSRLMQQDQIALMKLPAMYPELVEMEEPPEELLPFAEKMEGIEAKMNQINEKIMPFMSDPAVIEAMAVVTEEMESLMDMDDQ